MHNSDIKSGLLMGRLKSVLFYSFYLTSIFFFNLLVSDGASGSEKIDIITVGEGKIKGNNTAEAKNEAIADALKKGMEEYLFQHLGNQAMIGNFSVLINEVTPTAGQEIENFHILAEEKKGEKYSILVRVKVNEKLIEQRLRELGVVNVETGSIKVLFLVSQVKDSSKDVSYWWKDPDASTALTTAELKLYNAFQEQGLEPVNRLANTPEEKYSENMKNQELTKDDAIGWGKIYSADVVIKGKAALSAGNAVSVDLEAINVADGALIGKAGRNEPMNPADQGDARFANAVGAAVNNDAVQLSPGILMLSKKSNADLNKIDIMMRDVNNFEELRLFIKFLEEEISGIKSVVQSRIKGPVIGLSVEYSGSRDALLNKLKGNRNLPLQAEIAADGEGISVRIEHEIIDPKINQDTTNQQDFQ
jgi:hypothetical protein